VSKEETLSIFKKCKALLFFSDKEGLPNVVLEAMSQNCVPITTGIDGVVEEILDNRVHGFIINESYPPIDIVLIDNIIKNNKPYLNVENRFSINKIADSYINIY
jgi:glycosyltransferase involved in cell wall biosynthesis